jgi:nondiscriminating aspartyl-tRNA synthetase
LAYIFERLQEHYSPILDAYRKTPLPQMMKAPCWEFEECLELLKKHFNRTDLTEDLDPEGERQLCQLANERAGIPAVFVLGSRSLVVPFTPLHVAANSFDLLFEGIEITTGGQRLHHRDDPETALPARGMEPANFESHLRMFDLGMPPHGGFAIGLERLTARILNLTNVRQAVLYPRDGYQLTP